MEKIHYPSPAILRQSHKLPDHVDDHMQNHQISYPQQGPLHEEHVSVTPVFISKLLANFRWESLKRGPSSPLPTFRIHPTPRFSRMNNVAHNTAGLSTQSFGSQRRNQLTYQTPEHDQDRSASTATSSATPPQDAQEEVIYTQDATSIAHLNRRKEILGILGSHFCGDDSDSSSVLLCWGKEYRCRIIPVRIAKPADDTSVWQAIRQAWYAHRGHWRKRLPFFGVKEVSIAVVSIAGLDSEGEVKAEDRRRFIGTWAPENLDAEKRRFEQIIAEYRPQEFPCTYDPYTGQTCCFSSCVTQIIDDAECPERDLYTAERELSRLETRPFLTLAFSFPTLAQANGLLDREGIVHSQRDILEKLNEWHCPEIGELKFRALMISEGFMPDSKHVVVPLGATVLFLAVVGAKFVYRDWITAFTVGAFLVALVTLLVMWVTYSVAKD